MGLGYPNPNPNPNSNPNVGLQEHGGREGLDLLAEARVLGVQRQLGHERRGGTRELQRHEAVGEQGRVPG